MKKDRECVSVRLYVCASHQSHVPAAPVGSSLDTGHLPQQFIVKPPPVLLLLLLARRRLLLLVRPVSQQQKERNVLVRSTPGVFLRWPRFTQINMTTQNIHFKTIKINHKIMN